MGAVVGRPAVCSASAASPQSTLRVACAVADPRDVGRNQRAAFRVLARPPGGMPPSPRRASSGAHGARGAPNATAAADSDRIGTCSDR